MLLGPAFVGARARINPGGLQGAGGLSGSRLIGFRGSSLGGIIAAAGQNQAGSSGKSQGNFLKRHYGPLEKKRMVEKLARFYQLDFSRKNLVVCCPNMLRVRNPKKLRTRTNR